MTKDFNTPTVTEPPVFFDEQSNIHVKTQFANQEFPEQPLGNRLIVKPRELEMEYERVKSSIEGVDANTYRAKKSGIIMPEKEVQKIMQDLQSIPQLVDVVAVGPEVGNSSNMACNYTSIAIRPGDTIRVFLNQCEGKITVNEEDYLIYSERVVLTKVK